jgi:hypothetical protein
MYILQKDKSLTINDVTFHFKDIEEKEEKIQL